MSEQLAKLFHETYERLAPSFGYETRQDSAVPWEDVPDRNKRLMIAVAGVIELEYFGGGKSDGNSLGDEFFASSGYGVITQQPFVELTYNGRKIVQMPPEDSIALAHNLLACAEAAMTDAFLVTFMRETVGLEDAQLAGILSAFREFRDKRDEQQEGDGP